MGEIEDLEREIKELREDHHRLEKELVELKADIHYIRKNQDNLNSNLSKILFIIGGGFITAIVGFIIGGGLLK